MTCPPLRIRVQSPSAGSPERILELAGPSVVVGRGRTAQIRLPGRDVSAAHARLQWLDGELLVEDLGSINGTRIRDRALVPGRTYPLTWGEPLHIADYLLTVSDPATPAPATLLGEDGTATLAAHLVRDMSAGRDSARLRVRDPAGTERIVPLAPGDEIRLGRGAGSQVRLEDPDLSRVHAELRMSLEGATLTDLGSKNGFTVNGEDGTGPAPRPLHHGDVIRLGGSTAWYEDPAEALLAELNQLQDTDEPAQGPTDKPTDEPTDEPADRPTPGTSQDAPPGRLGQAVLLVLGLTLMGVAVLLLLWLFA
jgi:pSer/pThr/pTyr-binding forkhead associated (FHA) protein